MKTSTAASHTCLAASWVKKSVSSHQSLIPYSFVRCCGFVRSRIEATKSVRTVVGGLELGDVVCTYKKVLLKLKLSLPPNSIQFLAKIYLWDL